MIIIDKEIIKGDLVIKDPSLVWAEPKDIIGQVIKVACVLPQQNGSISLIHVYFPCYNRTESFLTGDIVLILPLVEIIE